MKAHRNSVIAAWISAIAITILLAYVLWLGLVAMQIANEREKCNHTPISQLQDNGEYQFCLELNAGLR